MSELNENSYYISYDELREALVSSKSYPCGSPVTNGQTEHEIVQDETLLAVINAIESCSKFRICGEKIVGVESFIDALKQTAKNKRMNYKKASISFVTLETLIRTIGLDSYILKK